MMSNYYSTNVDLTTYGAKSKKSCLPGSQMINGNCVQIKNGQYTSKDALGNSVTYTVVNGKIVGKSVTIAK